MEQLHDSIDNVHILAKKLIEKGIPRHYYSILKGGLPNETLCLVHEDKWKVYYSERGRKSGLKEFEDEASACQYFFDELCDCRKESETEVEIPERQKKIEYWFKRKKRE